MEKTDAESVEAIVEASSSDRANGISMPSHGAMNQTRAATISAVTTTPTVASSTPGAMTGRMSENLVSIPPVKRMTQSAIMPMNCVMSSERYDMKCHPKSMPTPRKSNSAGAPKR